jgi:hypothetical protein
VRGTLTAVSAISSHSAWAIGYRSTPRGGATSVMMHWNGQHWTPVSAPRSGSGSNVLAGLDGRWAVGAIATAANVSRSWVLRRSGELWRRVRSPDPGGPNGTTLTGVSGDWAVGSIGVDGAGGTPETKPLILHWTGAEWRVVACPSPSGTRSAFLNAISGRWAVGRWNRGTLIMQRTGTTWRRVRSPSPGNRASGGSVLHGVHGNWAVGAEFPKNRFGRTLVLHRDGASWRRVPSPNPGGTKTIVPDNELFAIDGRWAVGTDSDEQETVRAMILHRGVGAWSADPSAAVVGGRLLAIDQRWAVGSQTTSAGKTVVLIVQRGGGTWRER